MSESPTVRALIFANGDLNDGPAVQEALRHASDALIVAADGGARLALACGLRPQIVVGDMDSLTPHELDALRQDGAKIERYPAAKDETDLELALLAAVQRGATWLRILGAAGGRIDQMLANIFLLALPALAGCEARIVSGAQTIWLIGPGDHPVDGVSGDTISLIPLAGEARGVRTERMVYPLCRETLLFGPARGISNVIESQPARVALEAGWLLVVHTPGRA